MTASSSGLELNREAQIEGLRRLPRVALWVIAARLKTLSLSIAPVIAGTWIGAVRGTWRTDILICAMISAVAIQIGTNLWNDSADAARGVDTGERLGPPRVTALGLLDGQSVRRAAMLAFLVAAGSGLVLASAGGFPILLVGILSLLMGYLYSMGPYPLSMTPFGEVLVVVFFGVIAVAGTAYLHTGTVDTNVLGLGAILGLPAAAVLLINNHRDRHTDAKAGRRTLAIVIGNGGSRALYGLMLVGTVAGSVWWLAPLCPGAMPFVAILGALSLLLAWQMWRAPISTELNRLLSRTALFQLAIVAVVIISQSFCGT